MTNKTKPEVGKTYKDKYGGDFTVIAVDGDSCWIRRPNQRGGFVANLSDTKYFPEPELPEFKLFEIEWTYNGPLVCGRQVGVVYGERVTVGLMMDDNYRCCEFTDEPNKCIDGDGGIVLSFVHQTAYGSKFKATHAVGRLDNDA